MLELINTIQRTHFFFHSLLDLNWWEILAILFLAIAIWFLTDKVGTRKILPLAAFLGLTWIALSIIGKRIYQVDFHLLHFLLALFIPIAGAHLTKLKRLNDELTENLKLLSSFSYLFESKTAEQRIDSTLQLLKIFFPISEIIVFQTVGTELKPIGRMRKEQIPESPTMRQTLWREKIEFCEEASKQAKLNQEQKNNKTRVAIPLINEGEFFGVLYLETYSNLEEKDLNLLKSVSEQLARNFQRRKVGKLSQPDEFWWGSLSTSLSTNRKELLKVIRSNIKEQAFSIVATSFLKEAFAVAYLDGTLAYVNRQMRHLANFKSSDITEIDLLTLLDRFKTDAFSEPKLALKKVLQTGESYENELFFKDSGKTLKIQITLVEIPSNDSIHETNASTKPACFLIVINDITAIKENEKLRSDMVNLMSHEIRTPLTSIQGFAELLMTDDTISAENREFISTIFKESRRLAKMLNTFLSIARLEQSDKQEFHKVPVKLDVLVNEVVREMQDKAKRKRIRIIEKADPNIPPIAADKGLVAKAISHLIDNAIKYSPERTSVIITTTIESDYLRVIVEDRGYGIPKEEQEKIWQKFYRIAREGQDKEEESTGLGLALVKEIVERHNGFVEVESEVGFGSKFSIRLPRL